MDNEPTLEQLGLDGPVLLNTTCPRCKKTIQFPTTRSGTKGKCPACRTIFRLPQVTTTESNVIDNQTTYGQPHRQTVNTISHVVDNLTLSPSSIIRVPAKASTLRRTHPLVWIAFGFFAFPVLLVICSGILTPPNPTDDSGWSEFVLPNLKASDYIAILKKNGLNPKMRLGNRLREWEAGRESFDNDSYASFNIYVYENITPANSVSHVTLMCIANEADSYSKDFAFFGAQASDSFSKTSEWIKSNYSKRANKPEATIGGNLLILNGDANRAYLSVRVARYKP